MKRMTLNAAELDKFIILNGPFGLQNETLQEASKHEPWCKLVKVIEDNKKSAKPVLVFDGVNLEFTIGNVDADTIYLTNLYNNTGLSYTIIYDSETDQLRIEMIEENFLSEDNVRTLFGNQSIVGTGNIDLYRHELNFRGNNNASTITLTYYSSNKLPVDSAQDLTTITKAVNKTFIACTGFNDQDQTLLGGNGICFENNVWKFGYCYYDQGAAQFNGLFNLEEFHDNVSTI